MNSRSVYLEFSKGGGERNTDMCSHKSVQYGCVFITFRGKHDDFR